MAPLPPNSNQGECSEAGLSQPNQREDDCQHENGILQDESSAADLSSFQIRAFVSTIRRRDFHKCWPFRHKILEKCLSVGLKPFLPPFQPPLKGCDGLDNELEISVLRFQAGALQIEEKDVSAKSEEDCGDADTRNLATCDIKLHDIEPDAGRGVDNILPGREYTENPADYVPSVTLDTNDRTLLGIAERVASEEIRVEPSTESQDTSPSNVPAVSVSGAADILEPEDVVGHSSPLSDRLSPQPTAREDEDSYRSGPLESEVGPGYVSRGASTKKDQLHLKGKYKLLSLGCSSTENQVVNPNGLRVSMHEKHIGDISESLGESLIISEATALCNEPSSLGLPSKLDRSSRNGDDYTFTGLNFDTLIPQVCPVCLNFTSTSNTALNAHIDHCLESVLPGEKGESKECKSKIKPRKMRSMVDICATAPSRTLEDLELSSKLWALNDDVPDENIQQAATEDDEASKVEQGTSRSLKSGVVRRQPRTSLYRGSSWRSKANIEVEHPPEESGHETQHQLETGSAFQHKIAVDRSREHANNVQSEPELPCEDQELPQDEVCQPLHMASSIQGGKVGWSKKKEKRGSSNVTSAQDLSSQGLCQSDEEGSDDLWSVPVSLSGFTVLDTSAEEERRLKKKPNSVHTQETQVEEPQEARENHISKSGKLSAMHQSNVPFFSTGNLPLKSPSPSEPAKKRKRMGVGRDDADDTIEMEGIVLQQMQHFERLVKNKRVAPKIKSLLTLGSNSCQDKSKNDFEDIGNQRKPSTNGLQNGTSDKGDVSIPSSEPSIYKEMTSKRKSLGATDDDTHESSCNANKQARVCPVHVHASPENFGLDQLSGQAVFYRRSSAVSKRAERTANKILHGGSVASCIADDNLQSTSVEAIHRDNLQIEGRCSVISTSSNHQAGEEFSRGIVAKRSTMNVNMSQQSFLMKASHHGREHLESSGHGALHYSTSSEVSRPPVVSMALEKASCSEKQEAASKTTNDTNPAQQAVHCNVSPSPATKLPSQRFTLNVSIRCSTNLKSREDGSSHGPQRPHASDDVLGLPSRVHDDNSTFGGSQEPIARFPPQRPHALEDVLGLPSRVHDDNSTSGGSQEPIVRFPPLPLNGAQFSAAASKENTVIINRQLLAAADQLDDHGNYAVRSSVEHGMPLASIVVSSESLEKSGVNASQHIPNRCDRSSSLAVNRLEHPNEHLHGSVHGVKGKVNVDVPHQSQREYVCSQFLTHDLGPMILSSASSELAHTGRHQYVREVTARNYPPMSRAGRERVPLPSSLLTDLASTMTHTSTRQQERVSPSSRKINEEQTSTFQRTDLSRDHESPGLMPMQGMTKGSLASNGSGQLHPLQTALHAINGDACANFSTCVNPVATVMDMPGKTMSAVLPFSTGSSSTRITGRRQTLYGTELRSVLSNYGTLEYPGDQGVVHIFGSPVFKLMGQNVMVTNNNSNFLGMESTSDQNGGSTFYPSSSIRHVAVLPETLNNFSHNPSEGSFATSHRHGDTCISRSGSFVSDNVSIHPSALPPAKLAYSRPPVCKSSAILKLGNFGEKSHSSSPSDAGNLLKKQNAVSTGNRPPTEVFIVNDTPPVCNTSLSAFLGPGNRMAATNPSGGSLTSNMRSLSRHESRLAGQALGWQSAPSPCLSDIPHLDLSGQKSRYGSGTLADIVQSSERNNS